MSHPSERPLDVRRAVLQQLDSLRAAGILELPHVEAANLRPLPTAAATADSVQQTPSPAPPVETSSPQAPGDHGHQDAAPAGENPAGEPPETRPASSAASSTPSLSDTPAETPRMTLAEKRDALNVLNQNEVVGCTLCPELAAARTQTVFGVGNPAARVCFFGEAPGADEDRQGEPFVGRAGQLLTKIIEACSWQREDVYILNTIKCRPPGNRNPNDDEIENCRSYFERQLEIIRPEYIVCLGAVAVRTLLGTKQSVGKLRGRFHDYQGAKVAVTYHPAYLLRNPSAKADTWADMKMLLRDMGMDVPGKK